MPRRLRSVLISSAALFLLLGLPIPGGGSASSLPGAGEGMAQAVLSTQAFRATCLYSNSSAPLVEPSARIALVEPIFTSTPYSQYKTGSFYAFYSAYGSTEGNITSDLNWLSTPVSSGMEYGGGWGLSDSLYRFVDSDAARNCGLVVGRNVAVISDINVSQGAIFSRSGARRFDTVVMGFAEYVTQSEYTQLRDFVASGGRLILMGGDDLVVRVDYNSTTGYETYVIGHGFDFNGKTAWLSTVRPFASSNTAWTGSNYCCFHRFAYKGAVPNTANPIGGELGAVFGDKVFGEYSSHEEAGLTNMTDTSLVATFIDQNGTLVAAYAHKYGDGAVVCMCVFADDIISYSPSAQYFLILAVSAKDLGTSLAPVPPLPPPPPTTTWLDAVMPPAVVLVVVAAYLLAYARTPAEDGPADATDSQR
jgi:N,N-dimethylformamidase beta subunit-like, C-terminal